MDLLAQVLINGVLLGGLYAVMALGLALVWGVLNIVNLAHGAFIMLGAYVSWYLYTDAHIDPFIGLPITAIVMFAFGYALQRGLLNLVVRAPMFNTLLITFGLEVVLTYLAQLAFSADFRTINPPYSGESLQWGPVVLPLVRLGAFGVAMILTVGMRLFLLHSRLGRAIRATAQNLVAARLHGGRAAPPLRGYLRLGAGIGGRCRRPVRHGVADQSIHRRYADRQVVCDRNHRGAGQPARCDRRRAGSGYRRITDLVVHRPDLS